MFYNYDNDDISALDAITEAQKIAFAPMLFQAALGLRNFGILSYLDSHLSEGRTRDEIATHCGLSDYATGLLLDMGLSGNVLYLKNDYYFLGKIGHFLQNDTMTRVNMDFTQDVCYQALFSLQESLQKGKPVGLQVFSDSSTIYPILSQLPESAKKSWFSFDHYYSDCAFNRVLNYIFSFSPKNIYDVGGNTGKWAIRCCHFDEDVHVTLLDLPQQIELAEENIANHGLSQRITGYPVDLLSEASLPKEADVWWMSQFLDCFSEEQIVAILQKITTAMKPDAKICILELFWDKQPYEAGAFSLNAASLYFTCLANGNSRFYEMKRFIRCLHQAGLVIEQQIDGVGMGHSLLICAKTA